MVRKYSYEDTSLVTGLHTAIQENHPNKPYVGLWKTIYASIWEQQNNTIHSDKIIVTSIEKEKLIDELKEWKISSGTRLASNQQFLID